MKLKLKRPRATTAKTERPCPECGAPIRYGDAIKEARINGRDTWVHVDCRGRVKAEEQRARYSDGQVR